MPVTSIYLSVTNGTLVYFWCMTADTYADQDIFYSLNATLIMNHFLDCRVGRFMIRI